MKPALSDHGLLAVVLLAIFVVPGAISGTAIALPAIGLDTRASLTSLQWVVNAFNLAFACFTLPWGALADSLGRRRCFLTGTLLYTLASLLSAQADSALVLDIARALAGIGAAAIFSCGIALLSTHFDGAARLRAFALFGTTAGLGVSLGPTLSGLLLDHFGWRAIFWTHSAALALVLLGSPLIRRDRQVRHSAMRFDSGGALLFILALLALMTAIVQGSQWGWLSQGSVGLILLSTALLVAFIWQEQRSTQPMLALTLLANRTFVAMALVTVVASFGFVTLLTYLPAYLGSVLKLTATQTGFAMLLLTLPMLVCPLGAGKLAQRGIAPLRILHASLLCLLAGLLLLGGVSQPQVPLWQLALPLLLAGTGMGLSAGLVDGLALKTVPEAKAGMAAGMLNTFRLGSEAIAVALYGSLLATLLERHLHTPLAPLAPDATTLQSWINDVAAGNPGTVLRAVAAGQTAELPSLLAAGYNSAFQGVLWILAAIIAVLSALILRLGHPCRKEATPIPSPLPCQGQKQPVTERE